jgi:hypothetical protein
MNIYTSFNKRFAKDLANLYSNNYGHRAIEFLYRGDERKRKNNKYLLNFYLLIQNLEKDFQKICIKRSL